MRNPLPRALPTLGLSPHRMESSGFDHTRRHCEGHLVHPADPLSFGHGDGGPIILGGAVGPPAVVRKQTAKLKRDCAARVAAGEASLVPLLWADGLGCVGVDRIEWAEAYGADETDVPPVAHFCTACAEHYAIRREEAGCARCGVEFKVAGLVRGGRSELVLDQFCVMCREEDPQQLAEALGYGGTSAAAGVAEAERPPSPPLEPPRLGLCPPHPLGSAPRETWAARCGTACHNTPAPSR